MPNDYKETLADLAKRNLKVVAFVVLDADKNLSVMEYDPNGNAVFISKTIDNIQFNTKLKGNMVEPIAEIRLKPTKPKRGEYE